MSKNVYLIIDDEEDNLYLLEIFLKAEDPDCEIISCNDGFSAVETFEALHKEGKLITHIICDYRMPNKTGLQTIRELCETSKKYIGKDLSECCIKVRIFTSDIKIPLDNEMLNSCGIRVFHKPLNKSKLLQMIS